MYDTFVCPYAYLYNFSIAKKLVRFYVHTREGFCILEREKQVESRRR